MSGKDKRVTPPKTAVLTSCCAFFFVTTVCLLAVLVLIAKQNIYNAGGSVKALPVQNTRRLSRNVRPITYNVTLRPLMHIGTFTGFVSIRINVTQAQNEIVLHSKNLEITDEALREFSTGVPHRIRALIHVPGDEVLVLKTPGLRVGVYSLEFHFRGNLTGKLTGFYRSERHVSGTNTGNLTRFMATSKFEPTYARQAFPCFDEPNMKATYKVHLLKPDLDEYIALSNFPQMNETKQADGVLVEFEETVAMSTYLSCFIVSDFISSNLTFNNRDSLVDLRVYATPEQLDKTNYAGEVGQKVMEYYVNYFQIPYPLPKLDMVAIPDFVSGAMEHWGLVTYRETALLYSPDTHSASNKQRVATVVAHELAHSWFGNLVTMDWWNNLWLNEGFASYIEYKGVAAVHSDWGMMDQFLIADLHPVLSLDATQGSHPIIQTVTTPDQITEVFDTISYNKGAAVLRMLEAVVGEKNFQDGVTAYLNKFAFNNAVTQDLLDEIQTVVGAGLNVTEFMDTFTVQMGYPIIEVEVTGEQYVLRQKRFLKDYKTVDTQVPSPINYKWNIPVTFITDLNTATPSEIQWFKHDAESLTIDKPAGAAWLKFNPGQIMYYRVKYPEAQWTSLIEAFPTLSVSDRTHLLEESFATAESGDISYEIPLSLTNKLETETDYVVWSVASSALQGISRYLQTSEYDAQFKSYVVSLLKTAYENLGWDDSDEDELHLKKLTRVVVINLACVMDYDNALTEAKQQFDTWIANTSVPLSQNLRSIIYKFGMVNADANTWNLLFQEFVKETDANEKLKLLNGLANVRNPSLLTKLIVLAETSDYVRSQDYFTLLGYISANPVGQPLVWDYVRENWEQLVKRFTINDRYLGSLISTITARFLTNIKIQEMKLFYETYPEAGAGAAARVRALETVTNNINWLGEHQKLVEDWIAKRI